MFCVDVVEELHRVAFRFVGFTVNIPLNLNFLASSLS